MKRRYWHKEKLWPLDTPLINADIDDVAPDFQLAPTFSGDQFRKVVPYPVIVEAWDHRLHGSGRRRYHAEFAKEERKTIGRWQTQFREWYLRSSTPLRVIVDLPTLALLRRAVDFFATL